MPLWRIVLYVTDRNSVPFTDWYNLQDVKVRAMFSATLITLIGIADWGDADVEEFKVLTGRDAGLGEIRFEIIHQEGRRQRKRQLRCLGIWPPDGNEFVLLNGLEKSGRVSIPANAYTEAHRLKQQYGQGRGSVDEYFK